MKVKKKKKKKKRKMLGSQRKLVPRLNSVRRIQKSWSRILKSSWDEDDYKPFCHLTTVAKYDVNSNTTWPWKMVDKTSNPSPRNKNIGDDVTSTWTGGEGLEPSPPHPTPSKWKNGRIATKIGTKTKFGMLNSKIMVPSPKRQRIDHTQTPPL